MLHPFETAVGALVCFAVVVDMLDGQDGRLLRWSA